VPVGYRRSDNGRIEKTADRRVRQAIELVFEKILEVGSARQVLLWLGAEKLQLPVGVGDDRVVWKDASLSATTRSSLASRGSPSGSSVSPRELDAFGASCLHSARLRTGDRSRLANTVSPRIASAKLDRSRPAHG